MRLADLDARFIRLTERGFMAVYSLDKAQGVIFVCPKCFKERKGRDGAHSVVCWFANRGVPDETLPKPGRWNPEGSSIDDLSFVGPGAASIQLTSGCRWHGFIRNGDATL